MSERLFAPQNWHAFVAFVRRMAYSGARGMGADDVRPVEAQPAQPDGDALAAAAVAAADAAGAPFEELLARAIQTRRAAAKTGSGAKL